MTFLGFLLLWLQAPAAAQRIAPIRRAPAPVALACPFRAAPAVAGPRFASGVPLLAPAAAAPEPGLIVLPPAPAASIQTVGEVLPEGEEVYPRLLQLSEIRRQEADLRMRSRALTAAVERVLPSLSASVRAGNWNGPDTSLDTPCCGDAAPKLSHLLRGQGHAANVVEAEFHYYLMLVVGSGQIVIDPTIRQFFGGPRAPPTVPTVFVGTIPELHELFRLHASARSGSYGVQRIYFNGARVRNLKEGEIAAAAAQSPESPEYRPLR